MLGRKACLNFCVTSSLPMSLRSPSTGGAPATHQPAQNRQGRDQSGPAGSHRSGAGPEPNRVVRSTAWSWRIMLPCRGRHLALFLQIQKGPIRQHGSGCKVAWQKRCRFSTAVTVVKLLSSPILTGFPGRCDPRDIKLITIGNL
ncbi:hypothetical protein B0H67DRAFT_210039 [Lasiosphaeris hirsuta]|uniref:Uncharacterized protein n=1 Tax=Lasiosphaeris hirsuta TaxID=260670 RepID=A0AA40AS51_9PEZI|nr:hypothetical protein B0H67DRAFT_210039 [Lasiosphaeris hirsuta]